MPNPERQLLPYVFSTAVVDRVELAEVQHCGVVAIEGHVVDLEELGAVLDANSRQRAVDLRLEQVVEVQAQHPYLDRELAADAVLVKQAREVRVEVDELLLSEEVKLREARQVVVRLAGVEVLKVVKVLLSYVANQVVGGVADLDQRLSVDVAYLDVLGANVLQQYFEKLDDSFGRALLIE